MFCDLICLIVTSSVSWNSKNVHQWIDGGFSMDSLIGCRPFRCKVLPQTLILLFWVCYCSERKWCISVKQALVSQVFIWLSNIPKFYKILPELINNSWIAHEFYNLFLNTYVLFWKTTIRFLDNFSFSNYLEPCVFVYLFTTFYNWFQNQLNIF